MAPDAARMARLKKIAERQADSDAQDPACWTLERLAGLDGGPALDSEDACELIRLFAGDAPLRIPAVAGLLRAAARDNDGFASALYVLERKTNNTGDGPIVDAIRSVAASDPSMALRVAGRLLRGCYLGYAHLLIGASAAKLPRQYKALVRKLIASGDAHLQKIAVASIVVAHAGSKGAEADVLGLLERASESFDAGVKVATVDALVTFYGSDRRRCMISIERLAREHQRCAGWLAYRISRGSTFDDESSLCLLAVCAESHSRAPQEVLWALEDLAERHLEQVLRIVITCAVRGRYSRYAEQVLHKLGKAHKTRAMLVLLDSLASASELSRLAPAMIKCVVAGIGQGTLELVFEAIRSEPRLREIGLLALLAICDPREGKTPCTSTFEAVEDFLKSLAESSGIDVVRAIKGNGDPSVRCGFLIDAVLNYQPTDYDLARRNMGRFPALLGLFGKEWIGRKERSGRAHPLLDALGRKLPPEGSASGAESKEWGALRLLRSLDLNLSSLKEAGHDVAGFVEQLKNAEQFYSKVSELDFIMPFLHKCAFELEPKIGRKRLDIRLDTGGRPIYVEIFSPEMLAKLTLFPGAHAVPSRVGRKILDKARDQLRELDGLGRPAVLAIDVGRSEISCSEVEACLRGPLMGFMSVDQNGAMVETGSEWVVDKSAHAQDPASDVISAVVCYEARTLDDLTQRMKCKIIHNPYARVRLHDSETEFLEKCLSYGNTASSRPAP